ncbi:hypothetical protein BBAD15_g7299 [Beauveria bassiana D1-5]|uniref:Ca2+-modulated nonselective cation channel polycystin n=1 Tax=Beauveria bassiana D1-5 TaxID=1245745 RepID=A0A0A2VM23_BEABA|nr:hypothetical protein BBAD15_g7299 [Beauveria bassiana D1-5]
MTTEDMIQGNQDRQAQRRRPFTTWVKKLTNFKNSSDSERNKRHLKPRRGGKLNNPYPESGTISKDHENRHRHSEHSFATHQTNDTSIGGHSGRYSVDDLAPPTAGGRSMAGTVSTENDTARSLNAPSHGASSLAGTSRTVGGGVESRRGGDSTFSSPAPSVRSLTTTLTTIQSIGPNNNTQAAQNNPSGSNGQSIQFSQPFTTQSPASAIPAHLAPPSNPTTYTTATANNLLTDNASILTLASSSKRRRRRSMDTDASVRALAPSSLWGGSRESLPLSVLSSNVEGGIQGVHSSGPRLGAERTSMYSTTGTATAMANDRNSIYTKQGDGASVRSGRIGHGRPDSIGGGLGIPGTPLASPMEVPNDGLANPKAEW